MHQRIRATRNGVWVGETFILWPALGYVIAGLTELHVEKERQVHQKEVKE